MSAQPLAGKRLLDFSQGVAGPYCAMLLGDLGAEVIKVEPPEGDWARAVGSTVQAHESSVHLCLNKNKRSICLDLKQVRGQEIALALAQRCDIVVQNFRRGVMERFGLGYERLAAQNPRLVYATIFGFGEDGPLADAPASDSVMQAFGGLMSINGDTGGPPLRVGNMVSDMLAGTYLSQGVLAALLTLGGSGRGQRVSVSLLDALVAFQAPPVTEYFVTGQVPPRGGRSHPLLAPAGSYAVADGHVTLAATQPRWEKFCKAIGKPDMVQDPRFATNEARMHNREALQDILVPYFAARTSADVLQLARESDLICAPINDYASLFEHEQVASSGLVQRWEHPQLGQWRGIRNPVRYSAGETRVSPPPMLGEHGAKILADELGYDALQIARLEADGIVGPKDA